MRLLAGFALLIALSPPVARAQGLEPSPERIAFRYDDSHVIVRLDQTGGDVHDNPADQLTPLPPPHTHNTGLDEIGTSDELMTRYASLFGGATTGQAWTVQADAQHSFAATVETLAFGSADCSGAIDALAILRIAPAQQAGFQQMRGDHYLASPADAAVPAGSDVGLVPDAKLSAAESKRLREALNAALQARLADVTQPTAAEKRLRKGEGKLEFHAQRLRVGPKAERWYVRATWSLGDYAGYVLSAWATPPLMQLEGVESHPAAWIRSGEFKDQPPEITLGEILGVYAGADGWARVLLGKAADEGYEMEIIQLSPHGPKETDIAYGYGC